MVSLICFMKFVSDILLLCFILFIVEEGEDMRHIFWTWKRTMIYLKTVMRCCQHRETIKCKTFKDWRLYHESTIMFMKNCQALIYSLIFLTTEFPCLPSLFSFFHRHLICCFSSTQQKNNSKRMDGWMMKWHRSRSLSICLCGLSSEKFKHQKLTILCSFYKRSCDFF